MRIFQKTNKVLLFLLVPGFTIAVVVFYSFSKQNNMDSTTQASDPLAAQKYQTDNIIIPLTNLPPEAKMLEMVLIQPGSFKMGSPQNERGRKNDYDWPTHLVKISRPFYIGKYEITQAQWQALMGGDRHHSKFIGINHPVGKVTWNRCQKFIEKLNELGYGRFRLPTEAEWEFACRAGSTTRFSFGDAMSCQDTGTSFCLEVDKFMWWIGNSNGEIKAVGQKSSNIWGLCDMHGNISEWCLDIWEKPTARGEQVDPTGPAVNSFNNIWPLTNHVLRGGSIYNGGKVKGLQECRSAARFYEQTSDTHFSVGFRIVREYD